MRPFTSTSPNELSFSNLASVDHDKTRGQTHFTQFTKVDDVQSPKNLNNVNASQQNEIQILRKLVIQLDSRLNHQNDIITQIKIEVDHMKDVNLELMEKLKIITFPMSISSYNNDKREAEDHKKIKQEIKLLGIKFSEMKIDFETKQMSLEEKMRSIHTFFENQMKIFYESKMEFQDIYNSINQICISFRFKQKANELSLLKENNNKNEMINEIYHVDQKGYLMDSRNNYLLESGQMIKLCEKQILYLKHHYKLL